jgi:OmcA/MtrC family decaheme c-type cytochrome
MSAREFLSAHLTKIALLASLAALSTASVSLAQVPESVTQNGRTDLAAITDFHGTEYLLSLGAFTFAGKYFVDVTITDAEADRNGNVTVDFRVENGDGEPITGVTGATFNIAKLAPPGDGENFDQWVPYIYRLQTVTGSAEGDWPNPDGTEAYQGYREAASEGDLTDHDDGSYTYEFEADLSEARAGTRAIEYDRTLTHRVTVMLSEISGPTGDAFYDFVPDGSDVIETRDIIQTANCEACHGANEFHGHTGERHQIETCVTCHNPGQIDPHSGESLDMKVMVHKIHAGAELATIHGPDGIVFDNPATAEDESADNGSYAIWGDDDIQHTWWNVEYPAIIENCTKCHQGPGRDVDNWKNVPSAAACGSCHNDIDFVAGVNHEVATNDNECADCHKPSGDADAVVDSHDWMTRDPRHIQEFTVDLSVSTPANGTHFVAGESPVVTIALREDGELIDHTTVWADTDGDEGCLPTGCPPSDGKFAHAYLFVHGPRAERNPVLTTAARARVLSAGSGPFDLSADDAALSLKVDGGMDILSRLSSAKGSISVQVSDGTWADITAATVDEIVVWLNGNAAFAARATAYLEDDSVAIRSKNRGELYSISLDPGPVTDAVFAGDTSVHTIGGQIVFNDVVQFEDPANNDPKARWTRDAILYTLDPVDDLQPGTYVASVQISDRGLSRSGLQPRNCPRPPTATPATRGPRAPASF